MQYFSSQMKTASHPVLWALPPNEAVTLDDILIYLGKRKKHNISHETANLVSSSLFRIILQIIIDCR